MRSCSNRSRWLDDVSSHAGTARVTVFLFILVGVFAVAAGVALVRGLMAFFRDAQDLRTGEPSRELAFGLKQNRMMSQRVLFQGIAILLIALIGALASQR